MFPFSLIKAAERGERDREREREKTSDSTYHLFVLETDYPSVQRRKGKSMFE